VPPEHAADGRTVPSIQFGEESGRKQLVRITSSTEEPENAFVAVRYRDHWYSIDDRDFKSKSVFTFVMILFSLTESGDKTRLPVITIPTG
jgi:putative Ca2+/H+ antiporter (TMEM165/GDT1 family)